MYLANSNIQPPYIEKRGKYYYFKYGQTKPLDRKYKMKKLVLTSVINSKQPILTKICAKNKLVKKVISFKDFFSKEK